MLWAAMERVLKASGEEVGEGRPICGRCPTGMPRASSAREGPGQSPGGRGDQVVQDGGVRLAVLGVGAVVLGHGAVHPERDRLVLGRYRGGPQRALMPGDSDMGAVDDLTYPAPPLVSSLRLAAPVCAGGAGRFL
jgi:hypothetical protein